MLEDIVNPRRAPRIAIRCEVEIRHRLSVWNGETEDIGPGGCQIATPRVIDPGRTVKLAIRCEAMPRTLLASGKVVWMRANAPARLGIAFEDGTTPAGWFDALVQASPSVLRAARITPERLPRPTWIYLGRPPQVVTDFTLDELDVLRRVGPGVTLEALSRSFGPAMDERTRGALFALIARRYVVLDPAASAGPEAWRPVLAARESDLPARRAPVTTAFARPRTAEVQRLYDEALAHIGSGRLGLALDRLRDALKHAPDDAIIASTAKRISRWA
jgi:PilZ domain-containing protein